MTKQTKLIVFLFCVVKLTLHLIADSHSGFQGDEFLHIETGRHLAFGYMEFPPLIGVFAFFQNLLGSQSIYIHHIFSHLASIIILVYVARTTVELGGRELAVFIVLLSIIIAPGFCRSQQLFQPVVFSQLFWVLGFYHMTRFIKNSDKKSLWCITLLAVLGISVKYDAVFYIFGLSSLLLFSETRQALFKHQFWYNVLVALLFLLPNIIWQITNDFPVFQMFSRLYEKHLDQLSRVESLGNLFIDINPINSLLIVIPACVYFIKKGNRKYLPLTIAILFSAALLSLCNGKTYYFYPIILTILPFGALYWEQHIVLKRKWILYPLILLLFSGAVLIPFGMPVFPFNDYLKYFYKYEKKEIDGGQYGINYDEYYSSAKWAETMQLLKAVLDSLPPDEKVNCKIWGKHYGQAGAINLLGEKDQLPNAFSYHGSFYLWAPKGDMPNTIIALSYRVGDFFVPFFEEVNLVREIYNPYADNEEELYQRIYICKNPRQNFDQLKEQFNDRIFE